MIADLLQGLGIASLIPADQGSLPLYIPRIKQIHRDLPDAYLTLNQMKAVLAGIENHMPHEINFDLAWELAKANFRYRSAGEALSAFSSLRSTFKRQMEFAAKYPEARQDGFVRLSFELEVERRIDDPQERKEIRRCSRKTITA